MPNVSPPEWLQKRGGAVRKANAGSGSLVLIDGQPQYWLTPVPAAARFSCAVTRTVDGRRLDGGEVYPTAEEALSGGLEQLRKTLGW
jgi:hypothetical protein